MKEVIQSQSVPLTSRIKNCNGAFNNIFELQKLAGLNSIIIYDTEFTAWSGSSQRNWSLPWEHREIIQIGAVKVNLNSRPIIEDSLNVIVRPAINCRLSAYITELTGITQARVEREGLDLIDAVEKLYKFSCGGTLPLFSYGDDFEVIVENAILYGIVIPTFGAGAFDIVPLFHNAGIDTASYSSGTLHRSLNIPFSGRPHDALNDATSVALTLEALLTSNLADKNRNLTKKVA